jgi:hypothetical protein
VEARSAVPDCIDLERHRDLNGRAFELWAGRLLLALLCAVLPILALLNIFGQDPDVKTVANPNGMATLQVQAPRAVRSGVLFQARFDIHARQEIKDAVLVLDSGWAESMTVNTIEPSPTQENSHNGQLALDLGDIPAGKLWREYLEFQVNPVNLGSQAQGVTLYDGNVPLLHLNRTIRVWP